MAEQQNVQRTSSVTGKGVAVETTWEEHLANTKVAEVMPQDGSVLLYVGSPDRQAFLGQTIRLTGGQARHLAMLLKDAAG